MELTYALPYWIACALWGVYSAKAGIPLWFACLVSFLGGFIYFPLMMS